MGLSRGEAVNEEGPPGDLDPLGEGTPGDEVDRPLTRLPVLDVLAEELGGAGPEGG